MVQNKEKKTIRRSVINGGGFVTVLIAAYKKPKVLRQCLRSLKANAGVPFSLWIWDNSKYNIGLNAYNQMAKMVTTDLIVTVDEDVIKFPQNWLKILTDAFLNDVPHIGFERYSPLKKKKLIEIYGGENVKAPYWGWLGFNVVRDRYTNGALWPNYFRNTQVIQGSKYRFRVGKGIPQTCAMVAKELIDVVGFPASKKSFFNLDGQFNYRLNSIGMPVALLEDYKIYHACGPYYNRQYENIWKLKHNGQTIKQAEREYQKLDPSFDFSDNACL